MNTTTNLGASTSRTGSGGHPVSTPPPSGTKPVQAAPAKATAGPAKALPPPVQSQHRWVHFEIEAPGARAVFVVGTFNNWIQGATPLGRHGSSGIKWVRDIPVASGRHEYRFMVDGNWVDDPKAEAYVPNSDGGRNAVLTV